MIISEELSQINMICPYCKTSFKKQLEYKKKPGLFTILIKSHPHGENCLPFIAFLDNNGRHRGSQKIDNIETDSKINEQLINNARAAVDEIDKSVRFYHLKVPRKNGRGFEHKVAKVNDRIFMSSKKYLKLIKYLSENEDENCFGIISIDQNENFEGGILTFGKYLNMIYTLFWNEQNDIIKKNFDELKANSNLLIEKLLDIYDLFDIFF
ncbi:MAG: hypothetical protein ACTSR8_15735 [Promethearchaeota archaeon]